MINIIQQLIRERTPYLEVDNFSNMPGIYALFFIGKSFPLAKYSPQKDEIIYIGKTESSQASRDRDTHFANGKTGSSTLRRSFGSMLRTQLNLKPIPRGQADIAKNRTSHFKFDAISEEKLSEWMQSNLALAFYEYTRSVVELDELESYLIKLIKPVLNIDRKNPENQHKATISALRKETGLIAYNNPTNSAFEKIEATLSKYKNLNDIKVSSNVHKYEDIWRQLIPTILEALKTGESAELHLGKASFQLVGNRKSYSFRLEIANGAVENNIRGSAVARDLARVLLNNNTLVQATKGKRLTLRLDSGFTFHVEVN